jgi:methylated-DNA-[protein]-cysteine S-methyltransferase
MSLALAALAKLRRHAVAQTQIDSPLGPLLLLRTSAGLAGVWFEGQQHHPGPLDAPLRPADALLQRTGTLLQQYFDGKDVDFDVALDPQGTPFQQAVWQALRRIARGHTCSYGDLARTLAAPAAVRAVGAAIGRNPLSIVVPCHRVIGRDGSLTGYAGGLERKRALLAIESAHRPMA